MLAHPIGQASYPRPHNANPTIHSSRPNNESTPLHLLCGSSYSYVWVRLHCVCPRPTSQNPAWRGVACGALIGQPLSLSVCTCSTGATGMGSPAARLAAGLAATLAAGLGAGLEGSGAYSSCFAHNSASMLRDLLYSGHLGALKCALPKFLRLSQELRDVGLGHSLNPSNFATNVAAEFDGFFTKS